MAEALRLESNKNIGVLYRVVIPEDIRDQLKLEVGTPIRIGINDQDQVVIERREEPLAQFDITDMVTVELDGQQYRVSRELLEAAV